MINIYFKEAKTFTGAVKLLKHFINEIIDI